MSIKSEYVKKWRKTAKLRIIEAMGGECCICGYKKCPEALALHHLDPSKKDFNLGAIRASPKKWETIINEIKKCVLMCHNCHTESHYGLIDISKLKSPVIADKFVNYKEFEKQIKMDKCPICGVLKPAHNTTCSKECGAKIRYKIDWDKIDLLKELDECGSIVKVAEKIGCSDVIVGKRIKRLKNDLTNEKDKI